MMPADAQAALGGWLLAGLLALQLLGQRRRAARRRVALNRALHELRRPLQLLCFGHGARRAATATAPLQLAISALDDLDRELNGGRGEPRHPTAIQGLVGAAVGRWRPWARDRGGSIALRWRAGDAAVIADPTRIAQAIDNLIVNAIEHGGPTVIVEARAGGGRLRISVKDDGRTAGPVVPRTAGTSAEGQLRGHGLEVVRSVAAAHRGRFVLQRSERGAVAMLELPIAGSEAALAA